MFHGQSGVPRSTSGLDARHYSGVEPCLTQPRVALPKMAAAPGLAGGWINVTMLSEAGVCKQGVAALLLMLPEVSVATPHGSGEAILMLVQGKKCN